MGSRTACSRPRPRPVVFEAKAKASSLRGQGQYLRGQSQGQWSWLLKKKFLKMTFLIKIQLLNWQQNVYQSTSCPQNWASVYTSHTNKPQSQVAITFEKHKLAEECFSSPVWAHDQTTLAEYSLHWCRCCWNWQNFLQQWLQYLNCSFSLQLQPRMLHRYWWFPCPSASSRYAV